MNKIILVLAPLAIIFSGCNLETDAYKIRWSKSEQYCHDHNSTAYDFRISRDGIKVFCKNGLITEFTDTDFGKIIGPVVTETLKNFEAKKKKPE